ncbi:hypothetical protein DM790_08520 [Flavobacterium collinsii]|nr:hypothetical protein [Flavobacterium collinsii]
MASFLTVALGVPFEAALTGVLVTGLTVVADAFEAVVLAAVDFEAGVLTAVLVVLLTVVFASGCVCVSVVLSTAVSAGISLVFSAAVLEFLFIITIFFIE